MKIPPVATALAAALQLGPIIYHANLRCAFLASTTCSLLVVAGAVLDKVEAACYLDRLQHGHQHRSPLGSYNPLLLLFDDPRDRRLYRIYAQRRQFIGLCFYVGFKLVAHVSWGAMFCLSPSLQWQGLPLTALMALSFQGTAWGAATAAVNTAAAIGLAVFHKRILWNHRISYMGALLLFVVTHFLGTLGEIEILCNGLRGDSSVEVGLLWLEVWVESSVNIISACALAWVPFWTVFFLQLLRLGAQLAFTSMWQSGAAPMLMMSQIVPLCVTYIHERSRLETFAQNKAPLVGVETEDRSGVTFRNVFVWVLVTVVLLRFRGYYAYMIIIVDI